MIASEAAYHPSWISVYYVRGVVRIPEEKSQIMCLPLYLLWGKKYLSKVTFILSLVVAFVCLFVCCVVCMNCVRCVNCVSFVSCDGTLVAILVVTVVLGCRS